MSDDWKRLGAYVVQRRNELGYGSQAALEEVSDVSYRTISRLETGVRIGKNNLRKIESALRWQLGSMERILAGDEPVTIPQGVARREEAYGVIINATRDQIVAMANAYAEAFGDQAAEAFLLRAAEIRRDANRGAGDDEAELG